MQYTKVIEPSPIYNKVPILLSSNFIEPLGSEKKIIYDDILDKKNNWKKEYNWTNYMSSYGVPGDLCVYIKSNSFLDSLYKKFLFLCNQYLKLSGFNQNNDAIKTRCLNAYDPHYVWNSILKENENSVIGMYCFSCDDDYIKSPQIDFEYRGKLYNYTFKQYDLIVFPNSIDYAIRPPLTNKYQVIFNFGIDSISNIKRIFSNYI